MTALPVPARVFTCTRILRMTADRYRKAVALLAEAAAQLGPVTVIGIAHGGTTPANDIAAILDLPHHHVLARHNSTSAAYTPASGHVTCDITTLTDECGGQQLTGGVLLVDDICGTGATFTAINTALRPHLGSGATIRTAALCCNVGAIRDPDLWIWTVDDWVLFPWEAPELFDHPVEDLPDPCEVRVP